MKLKCNAKINYNLHVVGKKDNYHLLESMFVPINIYDYIYIRKNKVDKIKCNKNMDVSLINKTLDLFRKSYNTKDFFSIYIKKNIPAMAGLGGGSSDATMLYKYLLNIYNIEESSKDVDNLLKLGCDCPFFLYNKKAHVSGLGEIVDIVDDNEKLFGVLVFDDMYFSTKEVFDLYDIIPNGKSSTNDLEQSAKLFQDGYKIDVIKEDFIDNMAKYTSMSGSGGSVFGLFNNKEEQIKCYKIFKKKYRYVKLFTNL